MRFNLKFGTIISLTVITLLLVGSTACGNSSSSGTVTITPSAASLHFGQTQQFSANTSVTWEVNGESGGDTTVGTITSGGLYTAPQVAGSFTITAVSSGNNSQTAVATVTVSAGITITPVTATLAAAQTQQFTATITGTTSTTAIWLVNGTVGGNANVGTITTAGLYTAPATVANPTTVTVMAQVPSNTAQQASATVNLTQPPIQISPLTPVVDAGSQVTLSATATGETISPIWSVSCDPNSLAGCGSIDANGVYTAPLSPPIGGIATVSVKDANNGALATSTNVTVQFSNHTLSGSYAFFLRPSAGQAGAAQAGTIVFDGNGGVTSGTIDRSDSPGAPVSITGGNYEIGTDGRGTAVVTTSSGNLSWQLLATNSLHGFATVFDSSGLALGGAIDLQKSNQFGPLNGSFAAQLAGADVSAGSPPFALVGSLAADGAGHFTSGILDVNDKFGVTFNFGTSGSYTGPGADGRGSISLNTPAGVRQFSYAQIDSSHFDFVETDALAAVSGTLVQQPAGPFNTAGLKGPFAVVMNGFTSSGPLAMGGVFTLDGTGIITNRALEGVNQTVFDTGGSYSVTDAAFGRTLLTWTVNNNQPRQYVMYPSNDGYVFLEADTAAVGVGSVLQQTLLNPTVFSQKGGFSVTMDGFEAASPTSPEHVQGQIVLAGGPSFMGTLDIDNKGGSTEGAALQAGVYTVDSLGHGIASVLSGSAALPGGTLHIYLIDSSRSFIVESDGVRTLAGRMTQQF